MKFLSLLLSFIMTFTALPLQSLMNRGQDTQTNTEAVIENDDVTLEGGGGIGGLLTESIQQSQQNEAAKDEEENVSIENKILDVVMTDNIATVSFNNDKICKIIVAIFDEEGKEMLAHGMVENIEEYAETVDVTIDNGTIPQYYLLRAFLLDENNVALHKSFETNYYTKAHQEFLAKTTDDFEGEEILNLDEDKTNNFAVYNDGVIHITENGENTLLSADDETLTYVFENINSEVENLKIGDIVNYNSGDTNLIFKVKTITFDGTKATVTGDEELTLDEIFNFMKIDTEYTGEQETEMDMSESAEGVEFKGFTENVQTYRRNTFSANLNFSFGIEMPIAPKKPGTGSSDDLDFSVKLKGNADFSVKPSLTISYYGNNLDIEFSLDQTTCLSIELGCEIELKEIPLGKINIPLGTTGISIVSEFKFVVEAEGKISYSKEERSNIAFAVNKHGVHDRSKKYKNEPAAVNLEGKFFVGIKNFSGLSGLKAIEFGLETTIGLSIKGTVFFGSTSAERAHKCSLCAQVNFDFVAKGDIVLKIKLGLWKNSYSANLIDNTKNIGKCYFSHEKGFGWGECPNFSYQVKLHIMGLNGSPVENATVKVVDNDIQDTTNSKGMVEFTLPKGNFEFLIDKPEYISKVVKEKISSYVTFTVILLRYDDDLSGELAHVFMFEKCIASGMCGDNAMWSLFDNGTLAILGEGEIKNYGNEDVPWYNERSKIRKVIIDDDITCIGNCAFYSCGNLTSVTIPDSVTSIGGSAFQYCSSLTSVTIPDSVTSIGDYAFSSCSSLTFITVDENNEYYSNDEYGVLFNKNKTKLIKYPAGNKRTSYVISDSVTSIWSYAFYGCTSLTSVEIGNSVTSIGSFAFNSCSKLKSVEIPDSVTSIGGSVFSGCPLEYVTIGGGLKNIPLYYWGIRNGKLKAVVIRKGVTSIDDEAFDGCSNLASIVIPDSVTSIGDDAFYGCSSLTSVTIPDSVTSIGYDAFRDCSDLTSVHITSIESWCNISFHYYTTGTFGSDWNLYLNGELVEDLIIPDSVTSISGGAFAGCTSLTSVTIGDSVTSIGAYAFHYCTNLTSVTIPDSVTSIGVRAFSDCSSLTSVTIPDSVTSIGICAFEDCSSLTSVIIPDSVTSIGNYAFNSCLRLTDVYYSGSQEQWNKISIGSNNQPLLNATKHFNSAGPTVYASANVKTLAVRKYEVPKMLPTREYEVPKMLAESETVIDDPLANTVTKDDLVPGLVYTLIIMKGTEDNYALTNDSLLYITDAIADESGVATFTHYCNFATTSWVAVVYGECNHHASDWITVADPTSTVKGLKAQYCTKCSETLANEEIDIIPEKMVIESLPEKLTYSYGDTLDLTGLAVEYTYTDGRENVSLSESDYTVYGFDAYAFGVQTIIIESGIYKARFDITVDLTVLPESFTDKIEAGTTVETLAELYPNAIVYALTADGKKTADGDELLKTGMILQIVQPDGTVNSVNVIVKGDATGDGIVNGKDIIRVKKQISQGNAVEHIEYADINSDGVVNEDDITALMSF